MFLFFCDFSGVVSLEKFSFHSFSLNFNQFSIKGTYIFIFIYFVTMCSLKRIIN